MPKHDRIAKIAAALCQQRISASGAGCKETKTAGLTRRQIADAVGLKKSPYLTDILDALVIEGWAYTYRLTDTLGTYVYVATDELCAEYAAEVKS